MELRNSLPCSREPTTWPYPKPTSWRSILILYSHLRLGSLSGLFPSGYPTETLYATLISPLRVTCVLHIKIWVQVGFRYVIIIIMVITVTIYCSRKLSWNGVPEHYLSFFSIYRMSNGIVEETWRALLTWYSIGRHSLFCYQRTLKHNLLDYDAIFVGNLL